jgi:hypothetical protein
MFGRLRKFVFPIYEQTLVRNWFYTLAFGIVVPTGCRFAVVAWRLGAWFDKPLAIVAGAFIGITSVVTLLRVWEVPPQRTTTVLEQSAPIVAPEHHIDVLSGKRWMSARRQQFARDAACLGSTRR